jgi:hypothetical protein
MAMLKRGNPYHDVRGKFTSGAGAAAALGKTPAGEPPAPPKTSVSAGQEPIAAADDTEPRRPNKVVAAAQARIDSLQKQGLNPDAKKPVPMGKNVTLAHRTTVEAANQIAAEGFRGDRGRNTPGMTQAEKDSTFFVDPKTVENWAGYGPAVVTVTVPRKSIKVDETMDTYYPPPVKVETSKLKGLKVKRVK